MSSTVQIVTQILSSLTMASQIGIILFLIILVSGISKVKKFEKPFGFLKKKALLIAFIIALTATCGSLFFSEIANYKPCDLCWYQRIFMYPQVLLLGIALWKKDRSVSRYVIPMSVIGALIGAYQYIKSTIIKVVSSGSCSVTGPSCFIDYFTEYGYVTIPLMAFTAFMIILVMSIYGSKNSNKEKQ
jgi:disulfide bond formation protein DsbB